MLKELLAGLRRREEKQAASAAERYLQLVEQAADDRAVDENAAVEILKAAGKSAAELESDVQGEIELRDLRNIVAELPEAIVAVRKLEAEQEAHNRAWDEFRDSWIERNKSLASDLRVATKRIDKISTARTKLLNLQPASQREAEIQHELSLLKTSAAAQDRYLARNPRNGIRIDVAEEEQLIADLESERKQLEAARLK